MRLKKEVFNYIEKNSNWEIKDKELQVSLPLYIKSNYELWNSSIAGLDVLFARVKELKLGMPTHYNAVKKIEEFCSCNVVLVFDSLDSRSINRLIKKHISFVVKDKQIYMPFALMQLQTNKSLNRALKKVYDLNPDADTILVGYLSNQITNGIMIKDIASIISREARSTSIALALLESLEYLRVEKHGRSKVVYFISQHEVYERLKEKGKSPIKYMFYTNAELLDTDVVLSGYSALEKFSRLMDDALATLAISEKQLSSVVLDNIICEKEEAIYQVEVWNRNPLIFSIDGSVNPLYLLRLFNDEYDERTEDALEELEENIIQKFRD